jgi:hypothetical protein
MTNRKQKVSGWGPTLLNGFDSGQELDLSLKWPATDGTAAVREHCR